MKELEEDGGREVDFGEEQSRAKDDFFFFFKGPKWLSVLTEEELEESLKELEGENDCQGWNHNLPFN